MDAEAQFFSRMTADTGVTALVGQRIYPMLLPQSPIYPAITFQLIDRDPGGSLAGDTTGLDRARIQADLWGSGYSQVKSVYEAVRAAMQSGVVARFIDARDLYEDQTQTFRISADFYLWEPRG